VFRTFILSSMFFTISVDRFLALHIHLISGVGSCPDEDVPNLLVLVHLASNKSISINRTLACLINALLVHSQICLRHHHPVLFQFSDIHRLCLSIFRLIIPLYLSDASYSLHHHHSYWLCNSRFRSQIDNYLYLSRASNPPFICVLSSEDWVPHVSIRSHSCIATGAEPNAHQFMSRINLMGDQMGRDPGRYHSNSGTRPSM
jgi:hypothetical protein